MSVFDVVQNAAGQIFTINVPVARTDMPEPIPVQLHGGKIDVRTMFNADVDFGDVLGGRRAATTTAQRDSG
jgi:hypothetical protein